MSEREVETLSSVSVTSEEVARQIRAVNDPLTQQLAHLCELMRDFYNEQSSRHHEETSSFKVNAGVNVTSVTSLPLFVDGTT